MGGRECLEKWVIVAITSYQVSCEVYIADVSPVGGQCTHDEGDKMDNKFLLIKTVEIRVYCCFHISAL